MKTQRTAFMLAVGATGTAICLSVLAGWQRGGTLQERLIWIAIGLVLVTSAHLLPALIRDMPPVARIVGGLLWVACLASACYGHAVFFVFAQQHAGEQREKAVVAVPVPASGRSLTAVMAERANVTRQLAFARAQRCPRDCSFLEARRVTLGAKVDALNAEANDVRRHQAADDRVTVQRDALLVDPLTSRVAALLGVTVPRVDLFSGLTFAAVLEGVACLLWVIALRSSPLLPAATVATDSTAPVVIPAAHTTDGSQSVITAVTGSHPSETVRYVPRGDPVMSLPIADSTSDDVTRLAQEIAAGRVRPTVADIRRHLGCSQARAAALRRQIAGLNRLA